MTWSSILVADDTGEQIGEVSNPYDRTVSFRHNRPATAHFAVRHDDPLADRLLEGDLLVKLYNETWGDEPAFLGEITDIEEVVSEASKRIGVTAADPWWRLGQRLCGKSTAGYTKSVATDRGAVIKELIEQANAAAPPDSDTGIRVADVEPSSSDLIGPWYYKPIGEAAAELVGALDGPDWRLEYVEPVVDETGLKLADLSLYASYGVQRPHSVFAFSDHEEERGNVKSYRRQVSKQGMVNTGYSLPPGFPATESGTVRSWHDGPARAKWNWREGVIPSDLVVDDLRLRLVQEHVAIRKIPRQILTIDGILPDSDDFHRPEVPAYAIDFEVGDFVPFRAILDGVVRVDAYLRVYGVDLQINDEGQEIPNLHLVPEA